MRRRWVIASSLLLLVGSLLLLTLRPRPMQPPLLLRAAPENSWPDVTAEQREGIMALLQDAFEVNDRTVLREAPHDAPPGFRMEVLLVSASRQGNELLLRADCTGVDRKWTRIQASGLPLPAFQRFLEACRQPVTWLENLVPPSPRDFWELSELTGPTLKPLLAPCIDRARALTERAPQCASAHFALANLMLRRLLVEAPATSEPQARCEATLSAALSIIPAYPRAAYQMVRLKTDVGAPREALEVAFEFHRKHPRSFLAFGGLAYAARTAGILEGAAAALREREILCGGILADPGLAENTYLYLGEFDRFERTLAPSTSTSFSPVREFYLGYLRLLREDRAGAHACFRRALQRPGLDPQFEQLARVYDLALENRPTEALQLLGELRVERAALRVPDGEFTFKIAEAYAFLGRREEAMDSAARAFGHGFGCTRWYRESPLLKDLRELPRWQGLLQHLQERQDLMTLAFPPQRFRQR